MREQRYVKIDKRTGRIAEAEIRLLPDLPFAERMTALKAGILRRLGGEPAGGQLLSLRCDGCGTVTKLDFDQPALPRGWAEHDTGEYCPPCAVLLGL